MLCYLVTPRGHLGSALEPGSMSETQGKEKRTASTGTKCTTNPSLRALGDEWQGQISDQKLAWLQAEGCAESQGEALTSKEAHREPCMQRANDQAGGIPGDCDIDPAPLQQCV